ncbi:hypothetical protein [Sphingomonas oleivorans]|uniref:hypothetical protein n=1 Tax=Sphingomonas oleivorans TaxID=1735121 RepID=UPI0010573DF6|nr:hypothetical protein [Sphingomonas oleivorans]
MKSKPDFPERFGKQPASVLGGRGARAVPDPIQWRSILAAGRQPRKRGEQIRHPDGFDAGPLESGCQKRKRLHEIGRWSRARTDRIGPFIDRPGEARACRAYIVTLLRWFGFGPERASPKRCCMFGQQGSIAMNHPAMCDLRAGIRGIPHRDQAGGEAFFQIGDVHRDDSRFASGSTFVSLSRKPAI